MKIRSSSVVRTGPKPTIYNGATSIDNPESIDEKIDSSNLRPLSVSWIDDNKSRKAPSRLNVSLVNLMFL